MTCRAAGFSLIELTMIMVVVSIAALTVLSTFQQANRSVSALEQRYAAAAMNSDCAEHVLARKRSGSLAYASITTAVCDNLPGAAGLSRALTLAPSTAPCSPSTACRDLIIESRVTASGTVLSRQQLLLADY